MKEYITAFILMFWLIYPMSLFYMNVGNSQTILTENFYSIKEPTFLNQISFFGGAIKTYFQLMYMTVPDAPKFLLPFIIFLQLISILIVVLIIRG